MVSLAFGVRMGRFTAASRRVFLPRWMLWILTAAFSTSSPSGIVSPTSASSSCAAASTGTGCEISLEELAVLRLEVRPRILLWMRIAASSSSRSSLRRRSRSSRFASLEARSDARFCSSLSSRSTCGSGEASPAAKPPSASPARALSCCTRSPSSVTRSASARRFSNACCKRSWSRSARCAQASRSARVSSSCLSNCELRSLSVKSRPWLSLSSSLRRVTSSPRCLTSLPKRSASSLEPSNSICRPSRSSLMEAHSCSAASARSCIAKSSGDWVASSLLSAPSWEESCAAEEEFFFDPLALPSGASSRRPMRTFASAAWNSFCCHS
mmetsp:Transcript_100303/g.214931  ORF Transcript_100303/g.214931 Transcript_100303/m.214931 type:complete len:326 (+) Transcript_100303:296-1273(+)